MKKVLLSILGVFGMIALGGYVFRAPLIDALKDNITANMFVSADTDAFDPGLAIGEQFPALQASYQGRTVSDMGEFILDRGMVFIANRSADW